ncbi:MAG TPA: 2-oxo acid dehydrogenase subunit E2, partial [Bacteroidota bacterium]|nr:2-oxo acid dehydrogenase subunit E2 [Bacteroidota bacterium]
MDVRLPRLGEGADSGVVATVFVKEGDQVKKDQPVLELESEKAVASIPAPSAGTVTKIFVKEGDEIKVGGLIMILSENGAKDGVAAEDGGKHGSASATAVVAPARAAGPSAPRQGAMADTSPLRLIDASVGDESPGETSIDVLPAGAGDGAKRAAATAAVSASFPVVHPQGTPPPASPSLRKIARELGIDLHRVPGSERGGRIVMSDLRAYVTRIQQLALRPAPGAASATSRQPMAAPAPPVAPQAPKINFAAWGEVSPEKMTTLRKAISRKMTESWSTVPHIAQFDEIDVTDLLALRKKYAAKYEAKKAHLTLTSFALRAVVRTLRKHPRFNASIDEAAGEIILKKYFHIGIAVDT